MKRNKMIFLGVITFMSSLFPLSVNAEPVVVGEGQTPIQIEVIQSPIRLVKVQAPTFGTYEMTNKSRSIQATGDLVINVEDTRTENSSPWQVDYEISIFESTADKNKPSSTLKYKIGTGTLTIDGQAIDKSVYQTQEIELGQEKRGTLTKVNLSSANNFEYRIPKEKISIFVPENSTVGEYKAIQTVHLISLPESE